MLIRGKGVIKTFLISEIIVLLMKIKDLPDSSKPRERFRKHGPEALSDAELFAIILRTGMVGENVMEMSNHLISKFFPIF
jgi:DNA repair protein RadC